MSESEAPASDVSFGAWIQQRRRTLDLTQGALARRVGCSLSAIRKIESDERRPSRQVAELLAEHLDVPPEQREKFLRAARGQLRVASLPSPAIPIQPAPVRPFPVPLTPLVGREQELAALDRLLLSHDCRLLTIVGPGGIGKTRLAIEAACQDLDNFPDGIFLASLASLDSPAFLAAAVADALGLVLQGQLEPSVQLLQHLAAKRALLVLDNLEHLLDGVGLLAEILDRAPAVKILATSRERLNLGGEWVFEVQGLPIPPAGFVDSPDEYSALALFVHHARRARAGYELGDDDRPHVISICRMLEGMPLAIELAAAWSSVLSGREIAQEIERSLDFLATNQRDVPARQRSLRAAFDHSWNLLALGERKVLARLAVFRGGFNRDAAERVAGASLPVLLALTSKSLLRRTEAGRFDLHEVTRQYALSHLGEDPQADVVCDRHAKFYLSLLRDREPDLRGAAQREALQELKGEIDNLRAAWIWAVRRESFALIGQALEGFRWLCNVGVLYREGVEQIELAIQALQAGPQTAERRILLGRALAQQGILVFRQGRFAEALHLFEASLDLLRPTGNPALLLDALANSGIISHLNGDVEQSERLTREALVAAEAAGHEFYIGYSHFGLGYVASLKGHYTEGCEQMLAGLARLRQAGDPSTIAIVLSYLAPTLIRLGRADTAQAYLEEALALTTQVGDRWGMGSTTRFMGLAALKQGKLAEARSLLRRSIELLSGYVGGWDVAFALNLLGGVAAAEGDPAEARRLYLEGLQTAACAGTALLSIDAVMGLGRLLAQAGEARQALGIASFVLSHPASSQEVKESAALLRSEAEATLPADQVGAASAWAKSMSLDAIVAEFLEQLP